MPDPNRELVLKEIEAVFAAVTGPGGTKFGKVMDVPYDRDEHKGQNLLSVLEGIESYLEVVSPDKLDRSLEVELACRAYVPMGTSMRAGANNVLADIEHTVAANEKWGGHAYATFMQSNSVERDSGPNRAVEISLFLMIRYRTKRSDPRT